MRVGEVMTREVKSVPFDATGTEALRLLQEMKISGLPVVDKENTLLGMFTEKDILSYILPSYIEKVGRFIYKDDPKSTKKKFAELGTVKINQLMRKEVITTTEDTALCEVARIMLTQRARRLPVIDAKGKLIGIIAREDVLRAFAQETQQA
ncbi:MAG: CBS domain-containing protein [Candidatus Omnitrophota bacterium]